MGEGRLIPKSALIAGFVPPAGRSFLRRLVWLFLPIYTNRRLIWQLALHELRARYAGTSVGVLWAFVHPFIMIAAFWFVSTRGLRVSFEQGPPYFLFLFCGFVPWMAFSDAITGGTSAVLNHKYLVSKIAFPLEILPVVSAVASVIVHFVLLAILIVILLVSGVTPTVHFLQVPLFLAGLVAFSIGLSWTLGALNVFQRDVGQTVNAFLTVWFWMTPILWPTTGTSPWTLRILKLNPMYYVVEGYRDALLHARPLGVAWRVDLYFWLLTALVVLSGAIVFRRLKPHFAEFL